MKNKALLCGGHSKFGKVFAELLEEHYDLTNLNRQQINSPDILDELDDDYDFIFFNHNRGTGGFEDLNNRGFFIQENGVNTWKLQDDKYLV